MIKQTPVGVLEVDHILNVCQRRSKDMGITVKYDHSIKTACTDGKNILLPYISHPVSQLALDRLYGFVIHECGHHLRPKSFNILNSAQPPEHLAAIYNIVEDDGMERDRAIEWMGDCKALSIMNEGIVRELTTIWDKLLKKGKESEVPAEPLATMIIGQLSRLEWDEYSQGALSPLIRSLPKQVKELLSELEDEGWVERFRHTKDETDTWNVSCDLIKRLYPDHDQDEYEQIRQAGLDGADTEHGPKRDSSGDKNPCPFTREGEGEGEGDSPAIEPSDSIDVISWRDVVLSEHAINKDGAPGGVAIDWEGYDSGTPAYVMPTARTNVIDLSQGSIEDHVRKSHGYHSGESNPSKYMSNNAASIQFANQIRRYIQAKARSVVVRDKYHGRLDKGAIVKLALPPIDGGEYNKRIFYEQRKHTIKDTAIFVLTDWSGSMSGRKMKYAADASQRLVFTFERILNIPVALAAFTDRTSDCDIGYIKKFNTRGLPAEEIAHRFAKFYPYSCGNNDSDAVHWAWQQILRRKETRKLLIVISDGAPTDVWKGHAHTNLKYITKQIEKDKRVELYGVGVCSDAVRNYYTNYKVLNSPEEINQTLFEVIKEGYKDVR